VTSTGYQAGTLTSSFQPVKEVMEMEIWQAFEKSRSMAGRRWKRNNFSVCLIWQKPVNIKQQAQTS